MSVVDTAVGSAAVSTALATDMLGKVRAWQMCEARRRRDLEFNFSAGPTRMACPKKYLRLLRLRAQHFLPDGDGTQGVPLQELEERRIRVLKERFEEEQRRVHGDNWRETQGFGLHSEPAEPAARPPQPVHAADMHAAHPLRRPQRAKDFPMRTIHGRLARPATAKLFRQSTAVDLDQSMLRCRHAKGANKAVPRPHSATPGGGSRLAALAEGAEPAAAVRPPSPRALPQPAPSRVAGSCVSFTASTVQPPVPRIAVPAAPPAALDSDDETEAPTAVASQASVRHRVRALEDSLTTKREQREKVTSEVRDIRRNIATINQLLMASQRSRRHLR
eukprot:TRINITY_DN32156_c0_g1_i1.p1 TRINITY_DN32156_c0_g1~~TRINITY_DN32156_c0_g1_i1.p1  ORF type:complete len:361 (+),score=95.78 TRINITY_DN32156_c0_g1_i1:86-1084(+)